MKTIIIVSKTIFKILNFTDINIQMMSHS